MFCNMAASLLATIYNFLSLGNVLLLLFLLFLLHYTMVLYEFRDMPPGPRLTCLPVLGNIFSLNPQAEQLTEAFRSLGQNYGRIFSLKLGRYKFVMASTPEAVKEILVKKSADYAGRPQTYSFLTMSLGGKDIILGNYGPAWRFYRKLFTTALRQYLSDIHLIEKRVSTQAERVVQSMAEQSGKPFDPADCLMRGVADVICGITFKNECDTSNPELYRLLELNAFVMSSTDDLQFLLMLDFFPLVNYLPFKAYDRIFSPMFEIYHIIRKLWKERIETFDPTEPVEDFLSSLLRAKHDLENECECDEEKAALLSEDHFLTTIEDMFLAGYETTSTTLRFLVAFLVNCPKYQEDLQRELDEVVGEGKPCLDDRPNLPLIQATIFETLRLGNVLPVAVPHTAVNDTTLCGYSIPKGTIVFANLEAVHLDPNCWKGPTVFNPYRHIDEEGQLITNQGNFFPFGAGRRVCAGESLAKVELFLFVSYLLQNFTFLPEEGHPPKRKSAMVQFPARYTIRAIKRKRSNFSKAI